MEMQSNTTGIQFLKNRISQIHGNQDGTISVVSVFALLMFTMLLVMIVNVAKHVDDKVRMQNAADASAYSGGLVLTRGMNAVAYSNHLLCDVFAMTAFLREANQRNAEQIVRRFDEDEQDKTFDPPTSVLEAWEEIAPSFSRAEFEKFPPMTDPILEKVPAERAAVAAWGNMMKAAAVETLPVFEHILAEGLIPQFQRDVIRTTPLLAREVTLEVALRHGLTQAEQQQISGQQRQQSDFGDRGPLVGKLWRSIAIGVGENEEDNPMLRTLPIVDPDPNDTDSFQIPYPSELLEISREQRRRWSREYLEQWISDRMALFDGVRINVTQTGPVIYRASAQMSQFTNMYRAATCAQLNQLLEVDYPNTNVVMMLRPPSSPLRREDPAGTNYYIETEFQYLGAAYRRHLDETGPGLFANPLATESDALAFSQVEMYVPRRRYYRNASNSACGPWLAPGFNSRGELIRCSTITDGWRTSLGRSNLERAIYGDRTSWTLMNQGWTLRPVPTTMANTLNILQTFSGDEMQNVQLPNLSNLSFEEFQALNTH